MYSSSAAVRMNMTAWDGVHREGCTWCCWKAALLRLSAGCVPGRWSDSVSVSRCKSLSFSRCIDPSHTFTASIASHTHTLLHLEERLHVTSCTRTAFPFRIIHSSDSAPLHCQGFETCLFFKEVWTVFAFKIQTRPNSPTYTTPWLEVCTRRSLWVCRRRVETTSSERLPALQLHWWIILLHTSPEQI